MTTVVRTRQRPHPKPDDRMPPPLNFQLEKNVRALSASSGRNVGNREANAMATVRLQVLQGGRGSGLRRQQAEQGQKLEARLPAVGDPQAPEDRPIPPVGAARWPARGRPSSLGGRRCPARPARTVPSRSLPTGRPKPQRPRPAGPNRRLTPHGAAQQPLRRNGREPETPLEGPRKALGSRSQVAAPTAAAAAATAAALTRDGKVAGST